MKLSLVVQRVLFSLVVGLVTVSTTTHAFVVVTPTATRTSLTTARTTHPRQQHQGLYSSPQDEQERVQRLRSLGYSDDEIAKTLKRGGNGENDDPSDRKVRVDLVEDVDPLTLTAIGFGLIAFNFLVLGNLGDGGIGGVVATIINLSNQ